MIREGDGARRRAGLLGYNDRLMPTTVAPASAPGPALDPHRLVRRRVVLAMVTLYVLWSSTYLAIRIAVESLPPFLMAGARFAVAGSVLYAALHLRGVAAPSLRQWRNAGLIGLFLVLGGNGLVTLAETTVHSGTAAILVSTSSLWTTMLGGFIGLPRRRLEWAGIAVGLSGVVLLHMQDLDHLGSPFGIGLVLTAAVLWASGSILSLRLDLPDAVMSTAVQMLVAGGAMLVLGALLGERIPHAPTPDSLWAFGYLIFVAMSGFTAYNYAIRHARPAVATSYVYVNPVLAVLLGALVLGEPITPTTVAAMAIIVSGVILVVLPGALRRK